ncbi:hypothetical protein HUO09_17240 [Vibrio sp. Y2-5]|uniref:hypothetical protein n=1 Tax=Vibrio sp. Y2-5 TaxID=2743977 RepID=UPI001660722D|nr:hypothetical protein [Vibrio sp. Y2-5]MBD0788101.1 hypothetical protein [Vibrio sp. Y2-5]
MANSNQKLKYSMGIVTSMTVFAIAVSVLLLGVNGIAKIIALVAVFASGFGCAHSLSSMMKIEIPKEG